jgi:hypothetical protein
VVFRDGSIRDGELLEFPTALSGTKYPVTLAESSLIQNPANPLTMIASLADASDGS